MTSEDPGAPKILTAAYYERLNDLERRHWWCRSVRRAALALTAPAMSPGAVVLDAGCGAGGLLEAVQRRWPTVRAFGADVSSDALSISRGKGLRRLFLGSAAELPMAAGSVDVVFSNDVIQHLPERDGERAIRQAWSVLKSGGILCARSNLKEDLDEAIRREGFRVEKHLLLHAVPGVLAKLKRSKHGGGHDSDTGLSMTVPAAPVNALMDLYVRVEDFVAMRVPFALPAGDTQIVLARKVS